MSQCIAVLMAVNFIISGQPNNDHEKLKGSWKIVVWRVNGKDGAHSDKGKFVISDKEITFTDADDSLTYCIDASKKPKSIDLRNTKSAECMAGIYAIDGNELTLCLRHASFERPDSFEYRPGGGPVFFLKLRRE